MSETIKEPTTAARQQNFVGRLFMPFVVGSFVFNGMVSTYVGNWTAGVNAFAASLFGWFAFGRERDSEKEAKTAAKHLLLRMESHGWNVKTFVDEWPWLRP